jgi:hypothetical protein
MSLLDEIHEVMGGEHYGTYLAVRCPFHGDSHPSMMVYEDWYKCKSCDANGPTTKLYNKVKGGSIVNFSYGHEEDVHYPNPFRRWLHRESLNKCLHRAWTNANLNQGTTIYLREKRGIPNDIRRSLGIGSLEEYFTFPVVDYDRKIVGAFVRSNGTIPSSRYFVPKDQDPNLLYSPSWRHVEESRVIFLTFGPIDALSLHILGFPSISTLSGKTLDTTVLDDIRKRIIFIPDYGEDKEAMRLASRLGWRGAVCHFPYPEGTKDMNDVYLKQPELIVSTLREYTYANQLEGRERDSSRTYPETRIVGECSSTGHILSTV